MAQLNDSIDPSLIAHYHNVSSDHFNDHLELHRKTNALELSDSGSAAEGPIVTLGDANNAVASDVGAAVVLGGSGDEYNNVIGGDGSSTVNTTTTNATQASTGADFSSILGGIDNVIGGQAGTVAGAHNYIAVGSTHGSILGGSINSITDGDYGTIVGGTANTVSGDKSAVLGGDTNDVSGDFGTVAGGESNTVSANYSTVVGGTGNTVSDAYSAVLGGRACTVSGQYSGAIGFGAVAPLDAQMAQAYGYFTAAGDSQVSTLVRKYRSTTGSEEFAGSLAIPSDTTWMFTLSIVARREDADDESAAYKIEGCIDNNAGTTGLVGSTTDTVIAEDTVGWSTRVVASNGTDSLQWYVTGVSSSEIRWVARIDLVEVTG